MPFLINSQPVQQQKNGNDCGLFAIAFAVDLANKMDPSKAQYDDKKLRQHLLHCLESRKVSPFPKINGGRYRKCNPKFETFEVFCICRDVFFESDTKDNAYFMAECCNCGEWYHRKCTSIPDKVFTCNKTWECNFCDIIQPVSD